MRHLGGGQTFHLTPLEDVLYREAVEELPGLKPLATGGSDGSGADRREFTGFLGEVFAKFFSADSTRPTVKSPSPWAQGLHAVVDQQELARTRNSIVGMRDPHASGLATLAVGEAIRELAVRTKKNEHLQEALGGTEGQSQALAGLAAQKLAEAERQALEAQEALGGLGWDSTVTDPSQRDPGARKALLAGFHRNRSLRKILKLAGRYRLLARTTLSGRPKPGGYREVGTEYGVDLPRLLGSELAMLAMAEMEDVFNQRYLDESLLLSRVEDRPPEGLGPMVICLDLSGSMGEPLAHPCGEIESRAHWAKAVVAGCLELARRSRPPRDAWVLGFASSVVCEIPFPKDAGPLDAGRQLLNLMEATPNGGTDFGPPLQRAVNLILGNPVLRRADIVFVSDGAADTRRIPALLQPVKNRQGLRVWGIAIAGAADAATAGPSRALASFCDKVFPLSLLTAAERMETTTACLKEMI